METRSALIRPSAFPSLSLPRSLHISIIWNRARSFFILDRRLVHPERWIWLSAIPIDVLEEWKKKSIVNHRSTVLLSLGWWKVGAQGAALQFNREFNDVLQQETYSKEEANQMNGSRVKRECPKRDHFPVSTITQNKREREEKESPKGVAKSSFYFSIYRIELMASIHLSDSLRPTCVFLKQQLCFVFSFSCFASKDAGHAVTTSLLARL